MSIKLSESRSSLQQVRIYGVLIIILGIMMFPFYTMISTTLKPAGEIFNSPAQVIPQNLNPSAYFQVWGETEVITWVMNSFIISISTVLLTLSLAIPAAYVCARKDFVGKRTFLLAVLVVQMFAPVILIVGLFDIIVTLDLMDSYLSVIIPSAAFTLPFNIWMLYGYFKTIPVELEEAARIDGASQFLILRKIVLPLTKPALVASITYTFLYAWNRLLFVLTFLTSSGKYNVPRGIFSMVGVLSVDWRMMLTVAVIGVIPLLLLFAFLEEYIVAGMTSGAVKD
ncbi:MULTISPECIES: carbohydrate ABC transporter permease [unclassified Haladaptatus]|uniref:carbohydrate ABC transporter permease n=1 Tax=unclassified Haladaptatus TaxID=2622732 RepID=UPI0023E8A7F3|nr:MULTISPECIES: carbohydrate ABC transporter permease [unclassified Haladaptatus]